MLSEAMLQTRTIVHLDLSSCRLDDVACCLVAYALRRNGVIKSVVLRNNPIGTVGARSLLRIQRFKKQLAAERSRKVKKEQGSMDGEPTSPSGSVRAPQLVEAAPAGAFGRTVHAGGIVMSKRADVARTEVVSVPPLPLLSEFGDVLIDIAECGIAVPGKIAIDPSNPNGVYKLQLAKAEHRAIASELWEIAVKEKSGENWKGERIDGKVINISEDENSPWIIPPAGLLEFSYTSTPKPPTKDNVVKPVVFKTLTKLIEKDNATKDVHRLNIVTATAPEEYFLASHVRDILDKFDDSGHRVQLMTSMFTRVVDLTNASVFLNTMTDYERAEVARALGPLFYFHPAYPAGHFVLDLSRRFDFVLAKKLQESGNKENEGMIMRKVERGLRGRPALLTWDRSLTQDYTGTESAAGGTSSWMKSR